MRQVPEHVYNRVLQKLTGAVEDLESRPWLAAIEAVHAVQDLLTADVRAELHKPFVSVVQSLMDTHFASQHGDKQGPKPRPYHATLPLAYAAALVTKLGRVLINRDW